MISSSPLSCSAFRERPHLGDGTARDYLDALKLNTGFITRSTSTVSPMLALISSAGLYAMGDSSRV